jgi:hypothetical protein
LILVSGTPLRSHDASAVELNPDPKTWTSSRSPRLPNPGAADVTDTDVVGDDFASCASGNSMTRVGSGEHAAIIEMLATTNNVRDRVIADLLMFVSGTDAVAINKRHHVAIFTLRLRHRL